MAKPLSLFAAQCSGCFCSSAAFKACSVIFYVSVWVNRAELPACCVKTEDLLDQMSLGQKYTE